MRLISAAAPNRVLDAKNKRINRGRDWCDSGTREEGLCAYRIGRARLSAWYGGGGLKQTPNGRATRRSLKMEGKRQRWQSCFVADGYLLGRDTDFVILLLSLIWLCSYLFVMCRYVCFSMSVSLALYVYLSQYLSICMHFYQPLHLFCFLCIHLHLSFPYLLLVICRFLFFSVSIIVL